MWILGVLSLSLSAFFFANIRFLQNRLSEAAISMIKLIALGLIVIGFFSNNAAWGMESAIALSVSYFGIASFVCIYFQLDRSKEKRKHV